MADDIRQRYAEALARQLPADLAATSRIPVAAFRLAYEVMAVRDEEMERLRAQLPQCNGRCLRASDVLDDLSRVVGNPVARAHRSCPLHGDLEQAAWELDAALDRAEAERDRWRERAEKAEAALVAARNLCARSPLCVPEPDRG